MQTVADIERPWKEKIADLQAQLAECYRLTGADPDGNEDWRLAPDAVEEVRRLRNESDAELSAAQQTIADLRAKLAEAEREIARLESLREMEGAALVNGATMVEAAEQRADTAESRLAATEGELTSYKLLYRKAIDAVDRVFQVDSTKPPPLLPDFLRLGDCKFEGVVKLAEAYKALEARLAAIAERVRELVAEKLARSETGVILVADMLGILRLAEGKEC